MAIKFSTPKKVYFISHTHWDREWYLTQRQFQYRLQSTIREVVETLERDKARKFTLDGQTIILDDLLEWQPELEPRLRALIATGRLEIGPWYTMPDFWLAGEGALRRNLERGREMCAQWGAQFPKLAYVPDSFGMPGVMPRIFREFGFNLLLYGRSQPPFFGYAAQDFTWESSDGNASLPALFMPGSYLNAHLLPQANEIGKLRSWFEGVIASYAQKSTPDLIAAFNGVDHIWIQRDLPEIIDALRPEFPDWDFIPATLSEYAAAVLKALPKDLPTYRGTLQGILTEQELHGTWSSRQDVKTMDFSAEAWLCRTESAYESATRAGAKLMRTPLDRAWDWLLQNHAHDSICGCSPDATVLDQFTRYRHIQQVCTDMIEEALHFLGRPTKMELERSLVLLPPKKEGLLNLAEVYWDSATSELITFGLGGRKLPHQSLSVRPVELTNVVVGHKIPYSFETVKDLIYRHHLLIEIPRGKRNCIALPVTTGKQFKKKSKPALALSQIKPLLRHFELVADVGGLYAHAPVGEVIHWQAREQKVESMEAGPLRWAYRWNNVHQAVHLGNRCKSEPVAQLQRRIRVELFASYPIAIVKEEWTGEVCDARIRLVLPLLMSGKMKIIRDETGEVYRTSWKQMQDKPAARDCDRSFFFQSWVQFQLKQELPVTFFGNGLHEFGASSIRSGISITLYRPQGFVKQCGDWPSTGAQLSSSWSFCYALALGNMTAKDCFAFAEELAIPTIAEPVPDYDPQADYAHATIASRSHAGECSDRAVNWRPIPNFRSGWRRKRTYL